MFNDDCYDTADKKIRQVKTKNFILLTAHTRSGAIKADKPSKARQKGGVCQGVP